MSARKVKKTTTPANQLDRYLITGAMGQLGYGLHQIFGDEISEARSHESIDISNPKDVSHIPDLRPDVLINCAAYTNVARAELDPEESHLCWAANARGPYLLARMCAEQGIPLVHISTDMVFGQDRCRNTPYAERDATGPLGTYALSKLAGEHAILQVAAEFYKFRYVIIRTAGVFEPPWREQRNFPMIMRNLLTGKRVDEVPVVDDVYSNITYVPHLARAIRGMVEALDMTETRSGQQSDRPAVPNGVYHVTNRGPASWFRVAERVARAISGTHRTARLTRTTKLEYCKRNGRDPGKSPNYTCLGSRRYDNLVFGDPMPTWEEAIDEWNELATRYFSGQNVEYPTT